MLDICKQLFSCWEQNRVDYCHWKSNEHLQEGLNGDTDLDIFVSPSHEALAESLLAQCEFIKCTTQKGSRYPNVCEWMGFDSETGRLVHVHLHYQIITGTKYCKEYVYPIDKVAIDTRIKDPETGVFVTDPHVEIILLYTRIALKAHKKRHIKVGKDSQREIEYLKGLISNEQLKTVCCQILPQEGESLYSLIKKDNLSAEEWYSVYRISLRWLKPYRTKSRLHVLFRHYYYLFRSIFIQKVNRKYGRYLINQKTFPGRNVSICFLGQDGSGKSTVSIEICKWLNWKIAAHRFYLGSGEHYNGSIKRLIHALSRGYHKVQTGENKNNVREGKNAGLTVKKNKGLKGQLASFVSVLLGTRLRVSVAKRAYKQVERASRYSEKGAIAIFDRFPQIQFNGIYDGPKIKDAYLDNGINYSFVIRAAKKEEHYLQKAQQFQPSLIIKLILPPEESIRRKPFEDIQQVTKKAEITQKLVFEKAETHVVDATQDYSKEIVLIKRIIWQHLLKNR